MSLYAAIVFAIDAAIKSEDKCTDESTKHASFCETVVTAIPYSNNHAISAAFNEADNSAIYFTVFATDQPTV